MPEIFRAGVGLYLVDRVSRGLSSMGRSFNTVARDAARAGMSIDEIERRSQYFTTRATLQSQIFAKSSEIMRLRHERLAKGLTDSTRDIDKLTRERQALGLQMQMTQAAERNRIALVRLNDAREKHNLLLSDESTRWQRLKQVVSPAAMIGAGAAGLYASEFLLRSGTERARAIQQVQQQAPQLGGRAIDVAAVNAALGPARGLLTPEAILSATRAQIPIVGAREAMSGMPQVAGALAALTEARAQGRNVADPEKFGTALARISKLLGLPEGTILGPLFAAGMTHPDNITSIAQMLERLGPQLKVMSPSQRQNVFTRDMMFLGFTTQMMGAQGSGSFMRMQGLINNLMTPSSKAKGAELQLLGLDVFARQGFFDPVQFFEILRRDSRRFSDFQIREMLSKAGLGGAGIGGPAGLIALAQDKDFNKNLAEYVKTQQDMMNVDKQLSIVLGGFTGQLDRTQNTWKTLTGELGRNLQQIALPSLTKFNDLLTSITKFATAHPTLVGHAETGLVGGSATLIGIGIGTKLLEFAGPWGRAAALGFIGYEGLKAAGEAIAKRYPGAAGVGGPTGGFIGGLIGDPKFRKDATDLLGKLLPHIGFPWGPGGIPNPFKYSGSGPWPGTTPTPSAASKHPSSDTHVHVHEGAVKVSFTGRGPEDLDAIKRAVLEGMVKSFRSVGVGGGASETPAFHTMGGEYA